MMMRECAEWWLNMKNLGHHLQYDAFICEYLCAFGIIKERNTWLEFYGKNAKVFCAKMFNGSLSDFNFLIKSIEIYWDWKF
jgi:hypothetical protein